MCSRSADLHQVADAGEIVVAVSRGEKNGCASVDRLEGVEHLAAAHAGYDHVEGLSEVASLSLPSLSR